MNDYDVLLCVDFSLKVLEFNNKNLKATESFYFKVLKNNLENFAYFLHLN